MLISNQAHSRRACNGYATGRRVRDACVRSTRLPFFDPRRLIEQGQMQLLSLQEAEDVWGDCHTVACTQCGQHWQAIDREYHYPWWEWKAA